MTRLLFFILALGFIVQCTGSACFVKKSVSKTEQCPDDNKTGEEAGKEELKKEKDQISNFFSNELSSGRFVYILSENRQYYPSGFSSKPYLPPR
jgi:hypothetical protein